MEERKKCGENNEKNDVITHPALCRSNLWHGAIVS